MKGKLWLKFTAVMLVLVILTLLAGFGAEFLGIKKISDARLGIDIKGGVYATLYPDVESGVVVSEQELETAKVIIGNRLDAKGIFDRNLTTEPEKGRIILEIPYDSKDASESEDAKVSDQELIDAIGQTALLTFQEVDTTDSIYQEDSDGNIRQVYNPTGIVVVDGANVVDARVTTYEGKLAVLVNFDSEGKTKFAEATSRLVNQPLGIYLDDYMYSAPVISQAITAGEAVISGSFSSEEAKELAQTIKFGSLPFKLEPKMINSISPTLGVGALNVAVNAGIVAFILICLFMIIRYRLPGFIASISLFLLVVATLVSLATIRASITLPGIAGIILSVGMGVDANVIIFERIKEEIRTGKSLKASIDVGFKRAFAAILDANITTIIVAVVLYMLGSGPIKGFGITLGIGVLLSFLTAISASRIMLQAISNFGFAKNLKLYGIKEASIND